MGENTGHIDNRYSPIYQRGGSGSSATPSASASVSSIPRATEPAPARPMRSTSASLPDARVSQSGAARTADADAASIVEVLPEGSVATPPSSEARKPGLLRVNPFAAILWFLGTAIIALGLWALFAPMGIEDDILAGPYPQWIFIVSQSAGAILMGGSIVLAAAGVLSALKWERRRRAGS